MKAIRNLKRSQCARALIACLCLVLIMGESLAAAMAAPCRKFDEFSDLRCEDLSARLDAYSVQLNDDPTVQAYIVVTEGKYWEGRNPRRGEWKSKAASIKDYLVSYRGLKSERIIIVDGGQGENFTVELWLCPPGEVAAVSRTSEFKGIKFSKGRIKKSAYKWSCL